MPLFDGGWGGDCGCAELSDSSPAAQQSNMPAPRAGKPGIVEHLNAQALAKPVSSIVSLDRYYKSAELLLRQVRGVV